MSTDRLAEPRAELKSVLDERVAELKRVVADTEESTRHIIAAELEIDRSRRFRESLDEELGRVSQDVKALRARTEDLKSRQGERLTERDSLRDGVSELEIELDTLNVEVDQLRQTRTRRSADLESVRAEIDELRRQDEALEREIERHEKLRSELLDALQQKAQKLNLNK
ncbi:MAG: hypothetical protein IPN01_29910 [Deltaproteobacteria bacterium]|nr:hypothetical protein [Deltaproteobacteria bacterium]